MSGVVLALDQISNEMETRLSTHKTRRQSVTFASSQAGRVSVPGPVCLLLALRWGQRVPRGHPGLLLRFWAYVTREESLNGHSTRRSPWCLDTVFRLDCCSQWEDMKSQPRAHYSSESLSLDFKRILNAMILIVSRCRL